MTFLQPAQYQDMNQLAAPEFRGQWWPLGISLVSEEET
jgi:hypothetical protein